MMDKINTHDFDIFEVRKNTKENELITITTFLLHKHKIFKSLKISMEKYMSFITKIQNGYKDITYHNKTHGADLSATVYFYMMKGEYLEKANLDDMDFCAMIVGGACHDHEHPGFNNVYMVETRDELAIRYNDVSVLENHHVASTFNIIKSEKYDIFQNFEVSDFKKIRSKMIGCILATDMSKHFSDLGKFKSRITANDFAPQTTDKDLTMHTVFHLADISNPAKNFPICQKWTELLYVEFFLQGDNERDRGMSITYLMDRASTNIAKA
jgi:hypothetical protein